MNTLKRRIENSLLNSWSANNRKTHVNVFGQRVRLHGLGDLPNRKVEAARIDWNAPDAWLAENELVVDFQNEEANEVIF